MIRVRQITGLLMLLASSFGCSGRIVYQFVDALSVSPPAAPPSGVEDTVAAALETGSLEQAVRHLAAPEMEGRGRGTPGNARARAYIVSRLRNAGLTPLFPGQFEQPTFTQRRAGSPHAVNVGAYLPAADPGAGWIVLVAHYDHLGEQGGEVHPGADDNAAAVAMLLAIGDALGRARPQLPRHVVLLFPDAEEPPDIRTERMGSSLFWRHPPFPLTTLHCALVFDLLVGPANPGVREAGLGDAFFVLGAEASPGLVQLVRGGSPEPSLEPLLLGLPLIEAYPFFPGRRFASSDYHGLREHGRRPFLFVSGGRATTYHTAADVPDTLDYAKLARLSRWVARLLVRTAEGSHELGWTDMVADPIADARTLVRLSTSVGDGSQFPWLLRRALRADRARVQALRHAWEQGVAPTQAEYRELALMTLRLQAALWRPDGWWFAVW